MTGLIAEEPRNPWFHELMGQILFESGRVAASIAPYEKAVNLAPDEPLIRIGLASAQLETRQKALERKALANLRVVTRREPHSAFAWRQLAIAYGRAGKFGLSALAQAEEALARGKRKEALSQARRAEKKLKKGSSAWLRAQDIKRIASKKNG
jgi:predicted Zn-dependent protease